MKRRNGKRVARSWTVLTWLVIVTAEIIMASCFGGARFEPGDPVGIPPLPPSDTIVGGFSKIKTGDNTGTVYRLKDMPIEIPTATVIKTTPGKPSTLTFGSEFDLFFILQTQDSSSGITTDLAKGTMQPASPYISTGANGIAESGRGGDDVQVTAVGDYALAPQTVIIDPGLNYILETNIPRGSDDMVMTVVGPGGNGVLDTPPVGDDVVGQTVYIIPGPNGILETNFLFNDDALINVTMAGLDGIAQSGRGIYDVQGFLFKLADKYYTRTGIPKGRGEPSRLAISPGANGLVDTPCVFEDNFRRNNFNNLLEYMPISGGFYSGVDGIVQSGLGGDDLQYFRAYASVSPFSVLVMPGLNGEIETVARGQNDIQSYPTGALVPDAGTVVVQAMPGDVLHTCPAGDDYALFVSSQDIPSTIIFAGDNLVVDTAVDGDDMYGALDGGDGIVSSGLGGDDVQIFSANDFVASGDSLPVVSAGPNGILETAVQADESVAIYNLGWNPPGGSIGDCAVLAPPMPVGTGCALADSGLGPDDVQVEAGGNAGLTPTTVVVGPGGDGILDTLAGGDDVISGTDILAGPNGVSESGVWGDDIQIARRGQPTLLLVDRDGDTAPESILFAPVIIPGPDGVLDTPASILDKYTIMYNGADNATMETIITFLYGVGAPGFLPDGVSPFISSGLGGRGYLDAAIGCATVFDNGGILGLDDPSINNPPISECLPRVGGCSDDCQLYTAGSAIPADQPIIMAGWNHRFDTNLLGDDSNIIAVVDGGNGRAESGLGGDDSQVIPAGQGQPDAMEVVSGPQPDGSPRNLMTLPAGDDQIVNPGTLPDLTGVGVFTQDNPASPVDPDGDTRIENYATVDDGEYFSWEITDITNDFIPPLYGNPANGDVVDDVQVTPYLTACGGNPAITAGPNGILETVPTGDDNIDATGTQITCGSNTGSNTLVDRRGPISANVLVNPANAGELLGYISNGRDIYISRSSDGVTWDPPQKVISSGNMGNPGDPVVMSGMDGICETKAQGDDVQNIVLGQGLPNTIAIGAGANKAINSTPAGDDYLDGLTIRSGANGIRETIIVGDDQQMILLGQGEADSACVLAGSNGRRDTGDSSLGTTECSTLTNVIVGRKCSSDISAFGIGDDRPPFIDRMGGYFRLNRNSAYFDPSCNPAVPAIYGANCPWLPEQNETSIAVGGWSGFDALGVSDPVVFALNGTYYMYFTAQGAAVEPTPYRPDQLSAESLGPCLRAGLNQQLLTTQPASTYNMDNNASVMVTKRIGVATSVDGVNWIKYPNPIISPSPVCGLASDLSALAGIVGDLADLSGVTQGNTEFDYNGAFAPTMTVQIASDGNPVFGMIYSGIFDNFDAMSGKFNGQRFGVGLARSFDGVNWTKMTDINPLYVGGLFGSPEEESQPNLQGVADGFYMFFLEHNTTSDEHFLAIGTRFGAVYGGCLSVAKGPFSTSANTQATLSFLGLILLPAVVLLARRVYIRRRKRA